MRLDELVNGKVGCECPKNYSIIVILEVWETHGEEDMVSVLKELVICMHRNRKQHRTGQEMSGCQVVWKKVEKGPVFRWSECNPICDFMKVAKCLLCEMQ